MKQFYTLFLLLILFSCGDNDLQKEEVKNKSNDLKDAKQKSISNTDDKNYKEVPINDLVLLFFNNANAYNVKTNNKVVLTAPTVNANDYRVIIDYQVVDKRYIKVKNIKTGAVNIVKEGDNTGEIVLIERALRYYKFKIGNSIIKVDR